VEPDAERVVDPGRGRNLVNLQKCTYPTFEIRLVVHADLL
jgi:hypothetical protein